MWRNVNNILGALALVLSFLAVLYSLTLTAAEMTPIVGIAIWLAVVALVAKDPRGPALVVEEPPEFLVAEEPPEVRVVPEPQGPPHAKPE
jgi:hypothetical protein